MAKVITLSKDCIDAAEPYDIVITEDGKAWVVHEVTATDVLMKSGNSPLPVPFPRKTPGFPKEWQPMKPGKSTLAGTKDIIQEKIPPAEVQPEMPQTRKIVHPDSTIPNFDQL